MNKNIITISFFSIAVIFIIFELIIPFYNQLVVTNIELKNQQQILTETQDTVDAMKNLAKKYELMQTEISQLNQMMPDTQDLPGTIASIDAMTTDSGVAIESVNFQPKAVKTAVSNEVSPYNAFGTQINAVGSYVSFKNFIKDIENSLRLMDIRGIKFGLPSATAQKADFKFSIDLDTYYK